MDYIREAVEYLKNYSNLITSISNLKDEIYELRVDLKCTKELNYSDMPTALGDVSITDDAVVNKMFRLKKAEEEYKETTRTLKRMDKVFETFENSNLYYSKILKGYFIEQYTEDQLAKDLDCSARHLRRLKQKALRVFAIQIFGINAMK